MGSEVVEVIRCFEGGGSKCGKVRQSSRINHITTSHVSRFYKTRISRTGLFELKNTIATALLRVVYKQLPSYCCYQMRIVQLCVPAHIVDQCRKFGLKGTHTPPRQQQHTLALRTCVLGYVYGFFSESSTGW